MKVYGHFVHSTCLNSAHTDLPLVLIFVTHSILNSRVCDPTANWVDTMNVRAHIEVIVKMDDAILCDLIY